MGGESCANCADCIESESYVELGHNAIRISRIPSAFARAYPHTVDEKFAEHWDTWFTKSHVDQLVEVGINTVRVPVCIHVNILLYSILIRGVDRSARVLDR
jgi:aryl-phospho-beta-D-glucosidase BglC (GH1 family)